MTAVPEMKIKTIVWDGCYDDNWRGLITDDAFAHPAKFAPGLIQRIYRHGLERGYWRKGDLIGDPFGGIAGGGIMAGYEGLNWIGVELEERFVTLGNANLALHGAKWMGLGEVSCVKLVQGDSREFARIIGEAVGVVTSPPYAETLNHGGGPDTHEDKRRGQSLLGIKEGYGTTRGQIGGLPTGSIDGAVMSPPYADTAVEKSSGGVDMRKNWETYRASGGGSSFEAYCATQKKHSGGYGGTGGQIAALKSGDLAAVVTSPPYAESIKGDHKENETAEESWKARTDQGQGGSLGKSQRFGGYGSTEGNIGNLKEGKIDAAVTSPPYAKSIESRGDGIDWDKTCAKHRGSRTAGRGGIADGYGAATGQIGSEAGETYWQAMNQVYRQCFIALRPGGYAAIVVKDYVKDKARVPLCDQTLQLLTALGFEPVERIHAMLVKHTTRDGLFGRETKTTERKSFFRRLAEKKGSPRIDWEEVIIVRKPGGVA